MALHSPQVTLAPGTLVRISAWVRQQGGYVGSVDGAMLFDSAGGEAPALRLIGGDGKWKRFSVYRRVPSTGTIGMTVALTGVGSVWFDDLKIEPLLPGAAEVSAKSGTPSGEAANP